MGFTPFMSNTSGSAARAAKVQNAQQQYAIDQGTQNINAMFGGGMTGPSYSQAGGTYDPSQTYYQGKMVNGQWTYSPVTVKANGNTRDKAPGLNLSKGRYFVQNPGSYQKGFGDQFYNDRANAYTNYAMPQLGQQYKQAGDALQYGFANRGLGQSTARTAAQNTLDMTYGQGKQNIIDTGLSQANNLRSQMEQAREAALSQLYQTANPGQAQGTALALSQQVQAPSAYAPIGNAFGNILSQLALQQAYNNTPQLGYYAPVNNFNANSGALPSNQ